MIVVAPLLLRVAIVPAFGKTSGRHSRAVRLFPACPPLAEAGREVTQRQALKAERNIGFSATVSARMLKVEGRGFFSEVQPPTAASGCTLSRGLWRDCVQGPGKTLAATANGIGRAVPTQAGGVSIAWKCGAPIAVARGIS